MKRRTQNELAVMQLDFLDKTRAFDSKVPVKIILSFQSYDKRMIGLLRRRGFKVDFEMPLEKKVCGTIRASGTDLIKQLKNEGKIEAFEICGLSSVETM